MNNKVLDCTLRDGGYYTDWHFSAKFVENYLKTIRSLPINIIEVGYLSDQNDNLGPFYHLDASTLSFIKSKIRKNQKVFAMINFKEIKKKNALMEFGLLSHQIKLVLFRKWLKMCLILKKN